MFIFPSLSLEYSIARDALDCVSESLLIFPLKDPSVVWQDPCVGHWPNVP